MLSTPPSGTASSPVVTEGETARRMTSTERSAWRTAAEQTSMPSGRDWRARRLVALRLPAASRIADILSTAAWLVGRRAHPSGCKRRAEQSVDAKALKVSRYAREREARALAGEAGVYGVTDVDGATAIGLAAGAGALAEVEQGATRTPEFEADSARGRCARQQKQ